MKPSEWALIVLVIAGFAGLMVYIQYTKDECKVRHGFYFDGRCL